MEKELLTSPVLPIAGQLLLPGSTIQLKNVSRRDLNRLSETVFLAAPLKGEHQKGSGWSKDNFYPYAVTCKIISVHDDEHGMSIKAVTMDRVHVTDIRHEDLLMADYFMAPEIQDLTEQSVQDMLDYILKIVKEMASKFSQGKFIIQSVQTYDSLSALMMYLAQFMPLTNQERMDLLSVDSLKERGLMFIDLLLRQKEELAINLEMNDKLSEQANKMYRKQALRRQLEAIQAELREDEPEFEEEQKETYRQRIESSGMPKDVKKAMLEEAAKLENAAQNGAETDSIRTYLDFALALPWNKEEPGKPDLAKAREILNSRHYGMDKVKERIIQHLAVMQLRKSNKGSALLLVGPPGTGKTSLGKSIAQALGREYTRMSLGGVRDESEIRGHRRTYVGSMAGRVLQSMKRAGTTNPVMILDEMDKMMAGGFSGDPAAAMLEVLDPEQNSTFTDHYLDQPYDLSEVFFIGTANSLDNIPAPLLDRMEIIQISSYTHSEKFEIAKRHLLQEVLEDHGISMEQLVIEDDALQSIIEDYTMEAGCRGLKKRIAQIARASSEKIITSQQPVIIQKENLEDLLGAKISRHEKVQDHNPAGVVTGLAWTAVGGEVLFIEAADMPGSGQMILTGQLGDVMKESARISLSLLKSRLPMGTLAFKDKDLHIHVPAGATPKDGPSAGITLFTALASLILAKPVDSHIAMTGEVTLRGDVLPIGGLKEKLFGAMRAGITKVLIPWDNRSDLKEIPAEVLDALEIIPVKTVEDVLRETLSVSLPTLEACAADDLPFITL